MKFCKIKRVKKVSHMLNTQNKNLVWAKKKTSIIRFESVFKIIRRLSVVPPS